VLIAGSLRESVTGTLSSTCEITGSQVAPEKLRFTIPSGLVFTITFLSLFHEKDQFEESFCVTYTLVDPVWQNTLVDAVKPRQSPFAGASLFLL
jgi:hypothetical protein